MPALPRMYGDLASWWHLLSAPTDYEEEASLYMEVLTEHARRPIARALELGSGGGNNASYFKRRWEMTLVDLSPGMLAASRELNPECEHIEGDMRAVRLGRTFDAVIIHDAIMYMTTEADLTKAIETAAEHLEPGGAAIFVPDDTTESYEPSTHSGGHDGDGRAIRYLQWNRPAAPGGTTARTTFVYVLDEGNATRVEHEDHITGLFPRDTWLTIISEAGLDAAAVEYDHSEFSPGAERELFIGVKP